MKTVAKSIQLNLDRSLADALEKRRAATGTPTQEFIRRSTRAALRKEQQEPESVLIEQQ